MWRELIVAIWCSLMLPADSQLVKEFLNNFGSLIGVPLTSVSGRIPLENRLVLNHQLNELHSRVRTMEQLQMIKRQQLQPQLYEPHPHATLPPLANPTHFSSQELHPTQPQIRSHLRPQVEYQRPRHSIIPKLPPTQTQYTPQTPQYVESSYDRRTNVGGRVLSRPSDSVNKQPNFFAIPAPSASSIPHAPLPNPQVAWALNGLPESGAEIANVNDYLGANHSPLSAISDLARSLTPSFSLPFPINPTSPKLYHNQYQPYYQRYHQPVPKAQNLLSEREGRIIIQRDDSNFGASHFAPPADDSSPAKENGHVDWRPFVKSTNGTKAASLTARHRNAQKSSRIKLTNWQRASRSNELAGELVARERDDIDPLHEFLQETDENWEKKYSQPLMGKEWRYSGSSRLGPSHDKVSRTPRRRPPTVNNRQNRLRRVGLLSRSVVDDLFKYFRNG